MSTQLNRFAPRFVPRQLQASQPAQGLALTLGLAPGQRKEAVREVSPALLTVYTISDKELLALEKLVASTASEDGLMRNAELSIYRLLDSPPPKHSTSSLPPDINKVDVSAPCALDSLVTAKGQLEARPTANYGSHGAGELHTGLGTMWWEQYSASAMGTTG